MAQKTTVLFVCIENGGKLQTAAGLMRHLAGERVQVDSAGTRAGTALNDLSVIRLREVETGFGRRQPACPDIDLFDNLSAGGLRTDSGYTALVDGPRCGTCVQRERHGYPRCMWMPRAPRRPNVSPRRSTDRRSW